MKLSAMAAAAGVSTASIKYYIHEGLLPPGRKKNATTAVYDDSHLHRLTLIRWLRNELSIPITGIAELTRAIDDETLPTIELMGICQELALRGNSGLPASALRAPGSAPYALKPTTGAGNAGDDGGAVDNAGAAVVSEDAGDAIAAAEDADSAGAATPADRFDAIVAEALDRLGWPDEESAARTALTRVLAMADEAGYSVSADSVVAQCRAIAPVARGNIRPIGPELSRDEVCLRVIRGITMHNRQLIATSALTHASLSIMARDPRNRDS
ncbi:MerR family transcriptional regulator [Brevibacterium atlanticum]|uniref:MerR family transcriptional regulator n=1 Tax=Brevibacterium atlanticum TaxID=2697563 RepID=UPI001423B3F0|nr:MerR family transcriptional regulator [Brevibacterium atlanticum]